MLIRAQESEGDRFVTLCHFVFRGIGDLSYVKWLTFASRWPGARAQRGRWNIIFHVSPRRDRKAIGVICSGDVDREDLG